MKHNIIYLLLPFLLLSSVCHADEADGNNSTPMDAVYPRSPQAAALARYGEYPVGHTTGVPDITIPLYEVKVGDYTLPVSISYHASGIKVNDVASTVGLGWSLNAGGVITRTVCGAPDLEYASTKYYDYDNVKELIRYVREEGGGISILNDLVNGGGGRVMNKNYDSASDRYTFNFSTKSGVFRYSYKDKKFISVNYSNMMFEALGDVADSYFYVVDTDGTEYYFKQHEYAGVLDDENKTDLASWYLTEVNTKSGRIKINYMQSAEYFVYDYSESLAVGEFETVELPSMQTDIERTRYNGWCAKHMFRIPVVSSIEWDGNIINFHYANDREDIWKTRLTKVEIRNSEGDILKTVNLDNHSFWGQKSEEKRMMLRGLEVSDEGKYTFQYNDKLGSLPPYRLVRYDDGAFGNSACNEDYWGYYNGKANKTYIPKEAYIAASKAIYQGVSTHFGPSLSSFADRNPDEYYLKFGILQSITYPTGGRTDFDFEWNGVNNAGLRVKSISNYDVYCNLLGKKTYTYGGETDVADHPLETMAYPTYRLTKMAPYYGAYARDEDVTCAGAPEFPLNSANSILYRLVCETDENGDKIEYEYSQNPEPYWFCGRVSLGEPPHLTYGFVHDFGIIQPYLVRKSYKNSVDELLKEETYDYGNHEVRTFNAGTKIASYFRYASTLHSYLYTEIPDMTDLASTPDGNKPLFNPYVVVFDSITVHSMTCQLLGKTVKDFTTGVTTTETYTYDNEFRTDKPKTVRTVNSDGKEHVTEYVYTFDSDDPKHQKMALWYNMSDMIVGRKEYCDGTLLRDEKTDYILHDDWFYPESVSISVLSEPYREKYRFLDYNGKGNFGRLVTNRCDTTSVEWGYGGVYPVSIRLNGGHGTRYTWKPLFGVTSISKENGYTEYYGYTSGGRLSSVSDSQGTRQQIQYNYIRGTDSEPGGNYVKTVSNLTADGNASVTVYQYYDGIGRPSLASTTGMGAGGKYVYTLQEYDTKGRESCTWLPVIGDMSGGKRSRDDIVSLSQDTYGDSCAYSRSTYDALDRLVSSGTPGEAWYSQGKSTVCNRVTNDTLSVILYQAPLGANTLVKAGYYRPKTLEGEETVDEDGHTLTVFKDKLGRKVLERRAGDNDTYFVYNDLGQLRYVLSPQYQHSGYKAEYGYEYRYDSRGNIVKKILPGCEYIQYWYDGNDRQTFMQDAVLRAQGKYRFMLYDRQNRLAVQGVCTACDRGFKDDREFPSVTFRAGAEGFLSSGYDFPQEGMITGGEVEVVNYYDGYDFLSGANGSKFPASFTASGADVTGLLTGTSVLTSDGQTVHSIMSYDSKGRLTSTVSTTLDGMEETSAMDYTYTDNVASLSYRLTKGGVSVFSSATHTDYNRYSDKPETVSLSVTTGAGMQGSRDIATYAYDDLGRLTSLTRPGNAGSMLYGYDLHGWTTSVKGNSFEEHLFYADNGGLCTPCYNGNISLVKWNNRDYPRIQGYKYTYDNLNRLTFAEYGENNEVYTNPNRYDEKVLEYDRNGNILRFQRRGLKQDGVYGKIDNLNLDYDGNRLVTVQDDAAKLLYNGAVDFNGNANGRALLRYTATGALKSDTGRGIALIEYDQWDNPRRVQFTNGNVTEYIYTATGEKLRTVHYTAMPNITVEQDTRHDLTEGEILYKDSTDYHDALIIENGRPSMYQFDGGYCSLWDKTSKAEELSFHYYTKDHLGNNREVVSEDGTLEQVTNYYPFGTPYSDHTATGVSLQKYKYNGKELDLTHGLNTYDYGARQYYSVLLRWDRIDPLCTDYYHVSPYVYCMNNPVNSIDPDGRSVWSKALKVAVKVGSKVARKGVRELFKAANYAEAVSDITDNVRTVFDSKASTAERFVAGASLASEALPVSVSDVKDAAKVARYVHGNSKHSTRAQHAYDIVEKETGRRVKTGISSGKIRKDGKSYRAESQVRKWNKDAGYEKYGSVITKKFEAGEGARQKAIDYEKNRADHLRKLKELDEEKHKRP